VSNKDYYGYVLISYLIKNEYLLIRYGKKIDIYDINNNMSLVNHDQEEIIEKKDEYYGIYECLKGEMDIIFLCDYLNNLIITKNIEKKARIHMLKDNSLQYVKDFPYQLKDLKEIIKRQRTDNPNINFATFYQFKKNLTKNFNLKKSYSTGMLVPASLTNKNNIYGTIPIQASRNIINKKNHYQTSNHNDNNNNFKCINEYKSKRKATNKTLSTMNTTKKGKNLSK